MGVTWNCSLERAPWPKSLLMGTPGDQCANVGRDGKCPTTQSDSDCGLRLGLPNGLLVYITHSWVWRGRALGDLSKRHPLCFLWGPPWREWLSLVGLHWVVVGEGWASMPACWLAAWRGNGASPWSVPICLVCVLHACGKRQPHIVKPPWKPLRYLSKRRNGLHWKPSFDWCEVWDSIQVRIHAARRPEKADDPA